MLDDLLTQQEFQYRAPVQWPLLRRIVSESLYSPRQLARSSMIITCDSSRIQEYYNSCLPMVVEYYQRTVKRKAVSLEDVVGKIRSKKPTYSI